jgi:hypothetical protein
MNAYIITRITTRDGRPRTDAMHAKRLGRECSFISPPRLGASLLAECRGGGDGYTGVMRTSHVAAVERVEGGVDVATQESVYSFRHAAGQIGMLI